MNDEPRIIAFGRCWACGHTFTFDPDLVPSVPIDPATNRPSDISETGVPLANGEWQPTGNEVKQPICEACVRRANENRRAAGRPLIDVLPGAYVH